MIFERSWCADMDQLIITRPDDWHLHLRDGKQMASVIPYTVRQFARAIVMPNLRPPVTTTAQALAYAARIREMIPSRMVEQAYSVGLLGKGSDAANHQKLRQQIQQRLTEDIKALPALEKSAKDANALASLADVYASQQKWEQAQLNYSKAIAMGGLRREAETRLHAGIVLFKAGQKEEARKMWDSVQGDATAVDIAQLWKAWQANN